MPRTSTARASQIAAELAGGGFVNEEDIQPWRATDFRPTDRELAYASDGFVWVPVWVRITAADLDHIDDQEEE